VSKRPNEKRRAFARLDSGAGLAFSAQMPETKSIADIIATGADLQPHEAVAIVQQLITHAEVEVELTPLSPLSLSNVWLGSDGSVICWACATTPGVLEMARLLEEMLPRDGKARVPGALRYTMARALLEVDAPPFDSIAQFSATLKHHERGDRNVVLRELYARTAAVDPHVVTVPGERRRRTPSAAELRRQLREADEQLYLHLVSERAVESGPVVVPPVEPAAIEFISEPRPDRSIPGVGFNVRRWVLGGVAAAIMTLGAGYIVVERMTTHAARSPMTGLRSPGVVSQADVSAPPMVPAEQSEGVAPPVPRTASPARGANSEPTRPERIEGLTAGPEGGVSLRAETDSEHQIGPNAAEPANLEPNGRITSVYTPLSGHRCATTKEDKRNGSFIKACPGVAGCRLLIALHDERMSVTVVTPDDKEHPLNYRDVITAGLSRLGMLAEWRVIYRDGKVTPLALIVRVYAEDTDSRFAKKTSYLAVSKLTPSEICVTDRIPAGTSANEQARRAAIASAGRACLKAV
jgi:hypothetical protein